jgi:hypothetical protein
VLAAALIALVCVATPGWRADAPATHEIDLPRFRIHATDRAMNTARLLAAEVEQDRDFIATRLGGDYPGVTEIRVGEGIEEVVRLDEPSGVAPRWAAGLAHPGENLILLDAAAVRREGGVGIIRHELAHVALGELGSAELPRWFQEGMAVLAAGEWNTQSALAMVRAARAPIPLQELESGFPDGYADVELAYAESASFVEFLLGQHGVATVRGLFESVHHGETFEAAFTRSFGPRAEVEAAWLKSIRLRYTWIPVLTGSTTLIGLSALLCVLAWARLRGRKRARLAELALEEQALEAAERIRLAEAARLAAEPISEEPPGSPELPPAKPTVH